ncbi:MAG: SDR family NAD(P)-dependent oxidoreductase, partial [Bacteroidetes bacterium]|nr:SDR family NAD(P)-dependent oxidoreductase [Bacteroidota bacterium]
MYALVTGASKGIGKAIAEELAKNKFNILLVARSEDQLKKNATEIAEKYKVGTDYLAIDLSAPTASTEIFNWCTKKNYSIRVLVNNAGYGLSGNFERFSIDDNTNMMQLNMIALVQLTQLFLPVLKSQNKSYILNISSSAAY